MWKYFVVFQRGGGGEIGRKMNAFVKGTTNLKLETTKEHEISKSHSLKHRNKKETNSEYLRAWFYEVRGNTKNKYIHITTW